MKKQISVAVAFVVTAVVLVAIGIARKGKQSAKRQIAVIPKATTHIFWQSVRAGAEKAGREAGVKVLWIGPKRESDRDEQIQIIEDFIAMKVSGVVLTPLDSRALVPAVEKLFRRGIPCVVIDSSVDTDKYVSFIATDNYRGGVMAARRMGEIINGKGRIIVVKYMPGSASTTRREKGFIDTIRREFPRIRIVDSRYAGDTVETALEVTEDLLTRNPDIDGLYAPCSPPTIGAMRALESHKLAGKVKVVGFDVEKPMVDGLKTGVIDSFVVQNPYRMGYEGVTTLLEKLDGKEVPKLKHTEVKLITADNINSSEIREFLKDYIGAR
ncbi:MAG: ABC transporter substrate-binding protein [Planctomycetota bacterium]|jgi:ribose transport system substrate-binding protein